MEMIISHKSALEYWRLHGNVKMDDLVRIRLKNLPDSIPKHSLIRGRTPLGLSHPINVMTGNKNAKRKTKTVWSRLYTGPIPKDCFIKIDDELLVSTPQFCFFQMAGELSLIKLIELGFELCGSYTLAAGCEPGKESEYSPVEHSDADEYSNGIEHIQESESAPYEEKRTSKTLYGHPPLASTKVIADVVNHLKGVSGQKKTQRALRYIAGGSASPMETILSMLLTLPHKLGGYGLPMPVLNKRINIGSENKRQSGKSYYVCDLFWPKAKFAVEYDSDLFHTGADRIARDSEKRLSLTKLGITTITITNKQIRSAAEFESIAKLIAAKLGKQLRYTNQQFKKVNKELRGLLL